MCILRTILITALSALSSLPITSSAVPSIVGGDTRAIPIVLTPLSGSSGEIATTTLIRDLKNAGVFDLSPPAHTPSYSVTGASTGGRIEGSLLKSDGTPIFTRTYDDASLRQNAHFFADDIAASLTGSPGIAKSVIAFTIQKKGASPAIHLCDADGGTLRRVTAPSEYAVAPAISPDASYLVFTGYSSGYPEIQFLDLINGERHTLARSPGTSTDAAISPDGRSLAMAMSFTGNPEIFIASLGGSRAQLVTSSPGAESGPTWSPDGRTLVYSYTDGRAPHLIKKRLPSGTPTRLATGTSSALAPDYSPDGNFIAFSTADSSPQVAVLDLRSGRVRTVCAGSDPTWAPDGRHLACIYRGKLIVADTRTGRTRNVYTGPGRAAEPSWTR